jgi:FMN phosphatase YigB (HAD superfamily)
MKTILVDAVGTFVVDGKINQNLWELLEGYQNKKIILTNANDEQLIDFGLVNMPYEMFTLKHNPNKDNSEYFRKMLENFNFEIEEVLYFEHDSEAVKSAESVGIKSYYYNSEKKDLEGLRDFLDKNI